MYGHVQHKRYGPQRSKPKKFFVLYLAMAHRRSRSSSLTIIFIWLKSPVGKHSKIKPALNAEGGFLSQVKKFFLLSRIDRKVYRSTTILPLEAGDRPTCLTVHQCRSIYKQ